MSDVTRNTYRHDSYLQFEDEWPTEYPVYNRKNWNKNVEFSRSSRGGIVVDVSKTDHLDRDNYSVDEYIAVELTEEETKELIAFLQKTIGEDNVQK